MRLLGGPWYSKAGPVPLVCGPVHPCLRLTSDSIHLVLKEVLCLPKVGSAPLILGPLRLDVLHTSSVGQFTCARVVLVQKNLYM